MGNFAPKFSELNDDVLFGEIWSREDELSLRERGLITVTALMSMAKEVWAEEIVLGEDVKSAYQKEMLFPIGQPNDAFAQYFTG